jgi:hypothetical protein
MSYSLHNIKINVQAYLDDLNDHFKHCEDHPSHLWAIFIHCLYYKICLNPHKCIFFLVSRRFLGFIMSKYGLMVYPLNVKAITDFPPRTIIQLQSLQGKTKFLHGFISNYVDITKGFMHLINKGVPFV